MDIFPGFCHLDVPEVATKIRLGAAKEPKARDKEQQQHASGLAGLNLNLGGLARGVSSFAGRLRRGIGSSIGGNSGDGARSSSSRRRRRSCARKAQTHTVEKGEWLSSIALQHGVTTEALRDANTGIIEEGDLIFPGDQLRIP